MQKRSHKLLASALLKSFHGFDARRYELAFLFGSFQPDCNPFTYFKGAARTHKLQGHHYDNARQYMNTRIVKLQSCSRWTLWHYYTLGKLTHYLADAFTFPHNRHFRQSLAAHHRYESALRLYLTDFLAAQSLCKGEARKDLCSSLQALHSQYLSAGTDVRRDAQYIVRATTLLMAGCRPAAIG